MAAPTRNPKDSMKSTWRNDRSQWNIAHWFFETLDLHPDDLNKRVPVHEKTDKVPYLPEWRFERWLLVHALIPIALHQAFITYFGYNLPTWAAFLYYHIVISVISIRQIGLLRSFYEWLFCAQYVMFTEIYGHSGLRVSVTTLNPLTPLFQLCDVDLTIEDHDLHHRKGWRSSYNYGKQTRIWDRLFGTVHPRIESYKDNVDYVNTVQVPLFYGIEPVTACAKD